MESQTLRNGMVLNPLKKYPRNSPCPCGSEKKFKSCHLDKIQLTCTPDQARKLEPIIKAAEKGEEITIN